VPLAFQGRRARTPDTVNRHGRWGGLLAGAGHAVPWRPAFWVRAGHNSTVTKGRAVTFQQRLIILAALAAVIAMAALSRKPTSPARAGATRPFGDLLVTWLAVVACALLFVGIVSHTLFRHIVQSAPLVVGMIVLTRRSAWGVSASAALFAFWFVVMGAIWLFLLGLARFLTGTFTPAEITLTVIIGAASLLGLGTVYRRGTDIALVPRLGAAAVFLALQVAAMWLSQWA
jgi:hypothetical protein